MFTDEDGIYVGGRKPVNGNLVGDSMSDGNNPLEKANELGSSLNNSFVPGVDVPMEYIKATNPSKLTKAARVLHGLVKGLGAAAGIVGLVYTGIDVYKSDKIKNSHFADIGLSLLGFYLLAAPLTPVTLLLTAGLITYGLLSARHTIKTDKSLSEDLFD